MQKVVTKSGHHSSISSGIAKTAGVNLPLPINVTRSIIDKNAANDLLKKLYLYTKFNLVAGSCLIDRL